MAKRVATNPAGKRRRPGRPRTLQDQWLKVSVVLFERQVVALDHCLTDIRRHSGKVMNRAGLIRAVIDGFLNSRIDRSAIQSEADLRAQVTRRLKSR